MIYRRQAVRSLRRTGPLLGHFSNWHPFPWFCIVGAAIVAQVLAVVAVDAVDATVVS